MKRMVLSLAAVVVAFTAAAASSFEFSKAGYWSVPDSPRRVTTINSGWEFSLDAFKTARAVALPHCIDEGEIGFNASGCVNRQQPAWYRRRFAWTGGGARQFLHFEAIMGKSRVTLNGKEIAAHFGGYLPIHVEVTGLLKVGENLLEVWCDNSDDPDFPPGKPQNQLDFAYFGGIYRDAYLVETGDAYVTDTDNGGVYVTSKLEADGSWTVTADVTLGGAVADATTRLFYDGRPVVSPFKPANPALWSPDSPNLHLLKVEVVKGGKVVDSVGVKFGVRDFKLDANGLTLNGKPYPKKLIGANRHQDYLFVGMALPNSLHWRDVKKYKDCGMSVFRNAHYPQDPAFMDACDALGMFVIVNTPGWQFWNKANPDFERRVYDDILKMTRRDRSRASLLMWEPILNETSFPGYFVTNAVSIVKRETRAPNYCACDGISAGSGICDVNYGGSQDRSKPCFCREWGDFPDDWNAQNSSSRVPWEWGEGPQVAQAWHYMEETYWPSLKTQLAQPPRHFGGTLWHGADHARGYHPDNFFGGILTYGRQKKYSWYAFKAALTEKPFVFVAHEIAPYSPTAFTIYSNCAYTATWLGKPFVPGKTEFRYCDLHPLTYDWNHPERKKDAVLKLTLPDGSVVVKERAKRFEKILLNLDTEGLAPVADGSDLVAVTATLADWANVPKRYAREKVVFAVEGPAEIVGENPQETRWGEAIVLVRPKAMATPQPITVKARLVRDGQYARQNGFLKFTPGSLKVETGSVKSADAQRWLREVEKQQKDFNVLKPEPVKVFFDSDMIGDYDDVGAMAVLHKLADAGACEILATVSSTHSNASVGTLELLNHYFGRPDIPVGAVKGDGIGGGSEHPAHRSHVKYERLLQKYPGWWKHRNANDAPDATDVYRRVLAAQPDGSVTVVTVGFLTNLRKLLQSKPDGYSPLDGAALVKAKVKAWYVMGGALPSGREWNFLCDPVSTKYVVEHWPTPVVFNDFWFGGYIYAGRKVAALPDDRNPVRDIFASCLPPPGKCPAAAEIIPTGRFKDNVKEGHNCFDQSCVLAAVRGPGSFFKLVRGKLTVDDKGGNVWTPDPNGPHSAMAYIDEWPRERIAAEIDGLMAAPPRK